MPKFITFIYIIWLYDFPSWLDDTMSSYQENRSISSGMRALLCFFCFWTIVTNRIINYELTPWGWRCLPDLEPLSLPKTVCVTQILDATASPLDPSVSPFPPHFFLFCFLSSLQALFYQPISVGENMECGNIIQHGVRKVFLFPNTHSEKKIDYVPSKLVKHLILISAYSYLYIFIWKDTQNSITLVNLGERSCMTEGLCFLYFLILKTTFQK